MHAAGGAPGENFGRDKGGKSQRDGDDDQPQCGSITAGVWIRE